MYVELIKTLKTFKILCFQKSKKLYELSMSFFLKRIKAQV